VKNAERNLLKEKVMVCGNLFLVKEGTILLLLTWKFMVPLN
jgi:hypothetical protein